ncbi:MAG: hypothetical protein ISP90_02050 [Nevskia sp.]|nr:hypothetical protein [Nevskia sp.]
MNGLPAPSSAAGSDVAPAGARALAQWRRRALLVAVLALVAPLYCAWTWTGQMGQFANDGPDYLMMAEHFASPGDAGVAAQAAAVSRFPPLYPLLLAWSGAAGDLHRVHAVTLAAFLLALVALWAWLRGEGFAAREAATAVLLCAALPQSWLLGLTVQSEYLYLLCSLLALALLGAWRRSARAEWLYAAALAVAAAVLTRTIGVALLVPLALAALRAPRRSGAIALAIAVAPLAAWHLLHRSAQSYQAQLEAIYGVAPLRHLAGQLQRELPALGGGFLDDFGAGPALAIAFGAFGAACVAGALWRAAHLADDAVYLAAYAAILCVWPFPEEASRFLWVIVPVLAVQPVLALTALRRTAGGGFSLRRVALAATGALLAAALVPALVRGAARVAAAADSPLPDARAYVSWYKADPAEAYEEVNAEIVMARDLRQIQAQVPPQDCVLAVRPDLINFYARRKAALVPLASVPDPLFGQLLRASGCVFVFMNTRRDSAYPDVLHPLSRLGDGIDMVFNDAVPNPPGSGRFVISMLARLK